MPSTVTMLPKGGTRQASSRLVFLVSYVQCRTVYPSGLLTRYDLLIALGYSRCFRDVRATSALPHRKRTFADAVGMSALCRLCCKSLFARVIKNSLGSRCDFGINM